MDKLQVQTKFVKRDFPKEFWKEIGRGQFGTVYKCVHRKSQTVVAIKSFAKFIPVNSRSERQEVSKEAGEKVEMIPNKTAEFDFCNEVRTLKQIQGHKHVPTLYGAYNNPTHYYLVYEYFPEKSLENIFDCRPDYDENDIRRIIKQVGSALHHLHRRGVVHRDVKLENILVKSWSPMKVALTDFNFSKYLGASVNESVLEATCGSPAYQAPEVYSRTEQRALLLYKRMSKTRKPQDDIPSKGYNFKCDLWSLGVVAFVLLSGNYLPFQLDDLLARYESGRNRFGLKFNLWSKQTDVIKKLQQRVKAGSLKFTPSHNWTLNSSQSKDVVKKLLTKDPQKRIGYVDLLQHSWLKIKEPRLGMEHSVTASVVAKSGGKTKQQKKRSSGRGRLPGTMKTGGAHEQQQPQQKQQQPQQQLQQPPAKSRGQDRNRSSEEQPCNPWDSRTTSQSSLL